MYYIGYNIHIKGGPYKVFDLKGGGRRDILPC